MQAATVQSNCRFMCNCKFVTSNSETLDRKLKTIESVCARGDVASINSNGTGQEITLYATGVFYYRFSY